VSNCSYQFEGQLDFDLGNLAAFDPSPVDTEQFAADPDAACLTAASKITQALVAKLFSLPSEAADVGRVAQLPAPTTALPRAKPIPKPREPTKWEKFAQQKGITKHKRSREVWDEETQDFKRRFGFKGVNDDQVAVMDAKPTDQVSALLLFFAFIADFDTLVLQECIQPLCCFLTCLFALQQLHSSPQFSVHKTASCNPMLSINVSFQHPAWLLCCSLARIPLERSARRRRPGWPVRKAAS